MSRNAAAQDSAEGSFAGLLEHLTRYSRSEAPVSESASDSASRSSSASVSNTISSSGARSGTRTLLPVTELKTGRGTAMLDSAPLSYEKALRLHARRSTAANVNLDLPGIPPPGATPSPQEIAPGLRQDKSARRGQPAPSRANQAHRQNSVQAVPEPPAAPPPPAAASGASATKAVAQPRVKPRAKSSSVAEHQPKPGSNVQPGSVHGARSKKSSQDRQHVAVARGSVASPSLSSNNLPSESISRPARRSKLKSRAKTGSNALPPDLRMADLPSSRNTSQTTALARTAQSGDGKNLAKLGRHDLQWDPMEALDKASQRRAIVSLRLTDGEFLRIKDRASESGISVSAYMRSCVVDADQLRAQVKQALAEMRALSARPEPNHFPALPTSENRASAHSGDWFRLLMRSAAFLLSPLFPFRRSA